METNCYQILVIIITVLIAFLYETSSSFRYYTKFTVYYGVVIIESIVMIPVFFLRPKNVRNLVLGGCVTKPISTLIGMKWELRGADYLAKDECFIVVSNHQSSVDILGMLDIWHIMDKCTVVAKRELLYAVPFSVAAWLCGLVFIDRKHAARAKAAINEAVSGFKTNRIKLWIFPEGTRRNTGEIHPFKKGAFHAAISAQVPILPVVFSSYRTFMDKKLKQFEPGTVIISTLPPITTVGLTQNDVDALMERTRTVMIQHFNDITKEAEAKMEADKLDKKRRRTNWIWPMDVAPAAMQRVNLG